MVFIFASNHKKFSTLERNIGHCQSCDGEVNLVNQKSQMKLFGIIPMSEHEERLAICSCCGASLRAVHFQRNHKNVDTCTDVKDNDSAY
mmetsp:Transcript_9177/g.11562  ORF Transcript_9177/g.11562 Transcript_9177/m.11562 type:complete len:89 (+) Transcript_9177:136-402(+)